MGERCEKRTMYTIVCDECGREYGAWFDDVEDMRRQAYDDDWQDLMGKDGHRSWRCPDHWLFRCACCGRRFVRDWTESNRCIGTATPHVCDDCLKAGRKPEPVEEHGTPVVEYRFYCELCCMPYGRVSANLEALEGSACLDGWCIDADGRHYCPNCARKVNPSQFRGLKGHL